MVVKITSDVDRKEIDIVGTETLREVCEQNGFVLTSVVYINGEQIKSEDFNLPMEEFDVLEQGQLLVNISNKPSGGCK